MNSVALTTINNHLREIARQALVTSGDIESKRALVDQYLAAHPTVLEFDAKIIPVAFEHFSGEWIIAKDANPDKRVLYIHGGSWMAGRVEYYRPHIARISAISNCAVLAIDYRLAPEFPFPHGLEDCVSAFEWMLDNGPEQKVKTNHSYIIGDSAGGNLTLASLLILKDRSISLPDAAVALSPVTDLTWTAKSIIANADIDVALNAKLMPVISSAYLQNKNDPDTPYASPLFGDLADLPPILIQVGDTEILLDDAVNFIEQAKKAGVHATSEVYPDMPHVFQAFSPYLPEANAALESIGRFIKQQG